jgi:serine/threonine protein kinase/tetratricopeptide (TPR) repeat protein
MKFRFPRRPRKRQLPPVIENIAYTPHPLAPGAWLGEYKIKDLLSQTRSGYTYTANDGATLIQEYFPCDIAIRDSDGTSVLLYDEAANPVYEHGLSQFLLLARVLSQIDHPGRVVHYQEQHDTAWYAMNFEPRASVRELLDAGKRLPENALQSVLGSALIFLDAAHQNGIFHLELGPEQLILSADEELIVCGFNVARFRGPDLREKEAAYYFAPEHLHTAGRLGAWSDFYSLGTILHHGLHPRIPPTAARRQAALQAGKADPLVSAVKLGKGYYSEEFLDLVNWLLEISTGDRPKSVEHLITKMDPNGRVVLQNLQDSSFVSYGPAFTGQHTNADPLRASTDSLTNDDVGGSNSEASPYIPNPASGLLPADTAGLAIEALNAVSNKTSSPDEVASALEQTAKILEPATVDRRWAHPLAQEAEFNLTVTIRDDQITPSDRDTLGKPEGWRALLRPRAFSSTPRESTHPSNRLGDRVQPSNTAARLTRTGGLLLRGTQSRGPLLWLCLLGAITVAGIWLWQQTQSMPITEPTRIELLGLKGNGAIDQPGKTQTTATTSETVAANHASVESLLEDAKRYAADGVWFNNNTENAYATYQEALQLAPSNSVARNGVDELIKQSLLQISEYLDHRQLDPARALMGALQQRELAVQFLPELEQRVRNMEEKLRREDVAQALAAEQQRIEAGIRREKINNLLNRASNAFENGYLIRPQGENALTLYRAALDLDRNNQRARNGINSIGDHFVQQARMALATADLNRAEHNLQRAAVVRKSDPTILRLQQQLAQRRDLLKREQKIQAELASKQAEADRLALEQAKINLKSGIEAYYRGNYFEAYSFLYPLAENGIARAQVRVATMLLQGRGVSPSKALAREWFLKALNPIQLAAARGDAWAQSDYGDYFADGIVIPQNFQQAVIWYRRSAEQDYSPAQANLGLMHMHGSGVPPDWNEAIEWFRMAAAQGNYAAQENLRLLEVKPRGTGS